MKLILEAVVVITVIIALVLPSSAVIINNNSGKETLNMYINEIESSIPIGGPIIIDSQESPMKNGESKPVQTSRGTDVRVTFNSEFEGNPAIAIDSDGKIFLIYEYQFDILETTIFMLTSEDGGQTWIEEGTIHDWWGIEPAIYELSSLDYAGSIEDLQRFDGIFLCSENDYGDCYHLEITDLNNPEPEYWRLYSNAWSDHGFFEFSSCDVTNNDKIVGASTDYFVLSLVGSFEGISGYPDCYQVPFYQIRVDETSWIYWFYYNYSANGRMDIDRTAEIIYYAFEWENDALNQDIILLSSELEYVGQVEPEGWGDGMGEGRKYAVEGSANTINPAIAAEDNHVYLILETDTNGNQDIVCYYSSDGGDNYDMSVIADTGSDETNPAVYTTGENAYCIFTKNNDLYMAVTSDGGMNWEISDEVINDEPGSAVEQYKCADIYSSGIVWTDDRNDDGDVYFDKFIFSDPPGAPDIDGPNQGDSGTMYTFTFNAVDPDGDDVKFHIDWDDLISDTTDFTASGTDITAEHTWGPGGDYVIKARAEDTNGLVGPESTFEISIPRNRARFYNLFDILPNIFRFFNLLFG
jgi:hypothetical protein